MQANSALAGLKVLEFADFISGPYCARLLGDLGAEVIKVEEPGIGDRARRTGPFPGDIPNPESSGLFMALNTNKLGITVDARSQAGTEIIRQLVGWADIFIENKDVGYLSELDLSYDSLRVTNPRLIMTSITPFGQTGPYRNFKGNDLIVCNMSGMGQTTPDRVSNPMEQPPLKPGGRQSDYVAGATAAVATMFAVMARELSGEGQYVDISQLEAIASFMRVEIGAFIHDPEGFFQRYAVRNPIGYGPVGYIQCKDGYIAIGCREQYQWRVFMEEVLGPNWTKDKRIEVVFPDPDNWDIYVLIANWEKFKPLILEWTMKHTRAEIYQMARSKKLPIAPCNEIPDLFKSEQLKARRYFVEANHPVCGQLTYPGAPFMLSETPWQLRRPAPLLGEHNEEVLCNRLGNSREALMNLKESGVV
ncbi:CaiB/BaiF CoA transferase family protein [Chloroflexota bacterium]